MVHRLILVLLGLIWGTAEAQIYYNQTTVPPNLPVLYSDNYSTLQALSDAVPASGGTMLISSSVSGIGAVITLKSNTTVQCVPGVTLTMTDAGSVIPNHWIFANVNYTATVLIDSNIRILGCTFNGNSATPSTGADAIRMVFVSDAEVSGNTFTGFGDATAFLGTTRSLLQNNRAYIITNTCWDHWYAPSYISVIKNYCETKKHGIQITGTDTAQTSAGIAIHATLIGNDVVLFSNSAVGAGIYLNSGALTDTGAGVQDATIIGGHISTSGLGASVGDCVKVSGSGSNKDWVIGTHCDNGIIYVGPADTATSYPSDIHLLGMQVNITNTVADGAIQIKTGTSGVESSRVAGAGYAYCFNLIGATNQYAKNNSCVSGTDGTAPRVHTDGTSLATALIVDTDETGASPLTTDSGSLFSTTSFRSPKYIIGTTSNGFVQYAGGNKVVLDETDNGTGTICLRTDSGAGLTDRLCVANDGSVSNVGSITGGTLVATTTVKAPQYILGSASNGFVQYAGSNKVTLDETDSGTGTVCLRTDSGSGLADRLCVQNSGVVVITPTTVAALPAAAAGNKGARAFVTDATATTFASIAAGGGANSVPVYSDGTNWRIG